MNLTLLDMMSINTVALYKSGNMTREQYVAYHKQLDNILSNLDKKHPQAYHNELLYSWREDGRRGKRERVAMSREDFGQLCLDLQVELRPVAPAAAPEPKKRILVPV